MWTDPIRDEAWRRSDAYAARFDYDVRRIAADLLAWGSASGEPKAVAPHPAQTQAPEVTRAPVGVGTAGGEAVEALVAVLHELAAEHSAWLANAKANARDLERPDFLWHYLLQSFSTMGRSSGWDGLIGTTANYSRVTYEALEALDPTARAAQVAEVCRRAKIRMPSVKAGYILGCFERVRRLGGLAAAKAQLLAQPGRAGKIRFLKSFPGIGDKYARNMMMDVYHPDFRDSIAIDVRIASISAQLGLTFSGYADHEAFYLSVADRAGLNGWELDRLLYEHREEVARRLRSRTDPSSPTGESSRPE